ncbi:HEAT repeat domain-containing protein [Kitasatospora sp. NPDC057223]|uniref:HEAT repeat domain-containing protein n=1 Tax=Kitasatospora sp. NPDC057223 TaxID=3346055 RepID=UPI00362FC83B
MRARKAVGGNCGQAELQKAVHRTGLTRAENFSGQRISAWVPPAGRAAAMVVPHDSEVLLAVVAVWSAWAGEDSLQQNGTVQARWLKQRRTQWDELLEDARTERDAERGAQGRKAAALAEAQAAEVAAAVETYRGRVREVYRRLNLDVLGPSGSAGEQAVIELRQVFMPQLARPYTAQVPGEWRRLLAADGPGEGSTGLPPGTEAAEAARLREAYRAQVAKPVLEVLAGEEGRRLVVLGDPGAGKSTLTQYLALALAGGLHETPPELAGLAGLVPVVVELRKYAQAQWRERTFEDFLEHIHVQERMALPQAVLAELLAGGRVVMLFDGLDEVFDPEVRADTARRITAFAAAHPEVRTVVTSREYGYRAGEFTGSGFAQVILQDLERGQVEEFVRRWYTAAHPQNPSLASQLTQRLLGAVRQVRAVAELAGNPLLLTVLASMGLGRTIPRERREVYAHAVEVLIERWDKEAKFLKPPSPVGAEAAAALEWLDVSRRLMLLERVARRMQEGAGRPAGTFIRHEELTGLISAFLTDHGISRPAADVAADQLVEHLRTRNFLLAHYGGGIYGFVHRTFLEHLAARDLLRRRAEEEWTRDELVDLLTERASDPAWHEVLLLTAGGLRQRDVAALLARLLYQHRRNPDSWWAPMLMLAIRVLAEIKDIGPTPGTTDPHLSVAAQSDAVIDHLTATLRRRPYLEVGEAVPALGTFDRFWNGRERYLRWHHAAIACSTVPQRFSPGEVAAALSRDSHEAVLLAYLPWNSHLRIAALNVLGNRWPDREETWQAVLTATTDTHEMVRSAALQVLGESWPDREEAWQAVLTATTDTHEMVRSAALQVLGDRWPDREEAWQAVLTATTDTNVMVRSTALQVLGESWPDREETWQAVLTATTDTHEMVRSKALHVLGHRWPDREDARQAVLTATTDTHVMVRSNALYVLGHRWPDREDARQAVLTATTDTNEMVRNNALHALGDRWPDREETWQAVITATPDTHEMVRSKALQVLGDRWPDREEAWQAVITATPDTHEDVRSTALQVLGESWPDREEAWQAVLTATTDTNVMVRSNALRVLGESWPDREETWQAVLTATTDTHNTHEMVRSKALQVLGDRWPDREETWQAVLTATTDTHEDVRSTALQVLGESWPDREDTRQAVLTATTDTTEMVRSNALHVLAVRFPDVAYPIACEYARRAPQGVLRVAGVKLLALLWPEKAGTVTVLTDVAEHDEDEMVRGTAREALAVVEAWSSSAGSGQV